MNTNLKRIEQSTKDIIQAFQEQTYSDSSGLVKLQDRLNIVSNKLSAFYSNQDSPIDIKELEVIKEAELSIRDISTCIEGFVSHEEFSG